jgi:hypothetical protein
MFHRYKIKKAQNITKGKTRQLKEFLPSLSGKMM